MKHRGHSQGQRWIMGLLGVGLGLMLVIVFPHLRGISGAFALMGLFHVLGAVVVVRSGATIVPPGLLKVVGLGNGQAALAQPGRIDFGWTGGMNASWIFVLAFGGTALGLQLAYPRLWPAWFAVALLAVNFLIGAIYMNSFKRAECAVLPMVDLLQSRTDHVLDVGCGSGRTMVALGRILKEGTITGLDRFDASYIRGGGLELLENNVRLAGLTSRVKTVKGDITRMPFAEATFDSAASTHAMDHLGDGTLAGLAEVARVLKPGGRFLMVVSVADWTMFGLAALFSFFATTEAEWKNMVQQAGFRIVDEGVFNRAWYLLLEKPADAD
jgi:SAM-dependent methyltransferase